jgi:hypothetical protein
LVRIGRIQLPRARDFAWQKLPNIRGRKNKNINIMKNNPTKKQYIDLLEAFSALIAHTENFYSNNEAKDSPDMQAAIKAKKNAEEIIFAE